jgi:hypothetical protein
MACIFAVTVPRFWAGCLILIGAGFSFTKVTISRRRGVWIFFMREGNAVATDCDFASPALPADASPRAALIPIILYFLATRKEKQLVRQKDCVAIECS